MTGAVALTTLAAACTWDDPHEGQYWQRVSTSESVYQQGPKADQILDRDIGRCVVALQELEQLGTVKDPIKTDRQGRVLDPDEQSPPKAFVKFQTDRNYRDFDGCMKSKGWERVMHMPHPIKAPHDVIYSDDEQ